MENPSEGQQPHNPAEDIVEVSAAELAELKKKAEVSSQNYERLKKIEQEKAELATKLQEKGAAPDVSALEKRIEEKVSLKLSGHSPEFIAELEKYAKGAGMDSLLAAAETPLMKEAAKALKAMETSKNATPAPSTKIPVFNGKPINEVFLEGTDAEKQAAWEARLKGGVKSNE